MVIHAPATATLTFFCIRELADISPVVIGNKDGHVIRNPETLLIVLLNFLIKSPDLRGLFSRPPCNTTDDPALILNHIFKKSKIRLTAHSLVTITSHAYSDYILRTLHPFDTFTEELVNDLLVRPVIPCTISLAVTRPFLMIPGHRLMMRSSHYHTHLISDPAVFRIIGIKGP